MRHLFARANLTPGPLRLEHPTAEK
jgi:hypothetical protein